MIPTVSPVLIRRTLLLKHFAKTYLPITFGWALMAMHCDSDDMSNISKRQYNLREGLKMRTSCIIYDLQTEVLILAVITDQIRIRCCAAAADS